MRELQSPLQGVRIVEFEGIGPGPVAGRILAALGAEVTVIARLQAGAVQRLGSTADNPLRVRLQVVTLDLKTHENVAHALDLVATADALIEGNRPGVMVRLGLGPSMCAVRNPRLVYDRKTGRSVTLTKFRFS
ncbi:crotonobetainyl-CoA:carnitine CoA-transferase CaiB-like acyl-CoA transferase [Variovorax boronicumulans]|uniref:Crotonobetainyl-CoA:carnitine CoA-transferase CaiB-like acyl-CoA transferase n=1 Tax=Variovorax boronicumulans TaxID=436515 RepID=A0AAW8DUW6_9BURK|nr:CoA transferase [Variovorax boronicumulans]MDP9877940.1 crotonobetainyl-CoA:carnitine CoA-transferase CaiB-like acyl-CoA transferase [Variovorax boronicumulans]MDP9923224.1 crotonobetainyl-CoA:carnitine CoA-transferase CaiB-like acyl-CoA transferase [Variovorax boronicumulans]